MSLRKIKGKIGWAMFPVTVTAFATVAFVLQILCSAKNVKFTDERCAEAQGVVVKLLQTLSSYDIRDSNTREHIKEFFESEDDMDVFIASLVYKIREKKAFYGIIEKFSIMNSHYDDDSGNCKFEVYLRLKKKYPFEDIQFTYSLTLFQLGGRWFVEPPQYVGEINPRRKEE